MTETIIRIDHARRAEIESNAVQLLRLNNVLVHEGDARPIALVAESLGYLTMDNETRLSIGLPEKPTTEVY